MILALILCNLAVVVDGDTIKCQADGRIRLASIDAADKTSSLPCREHTGDHVCDNAKAAEAKAAMIAYVAGRKVTYRIVGQDTRYGRIVAQMFAGGHDLQCHMLAIHQARYLVDYDRRYHLVIARRCPRIVAKADR